jgi:pimeloyl-ACP methyl ester carboxylesterase
MNRILFLVLIILSCTHCDAQNIPTKEQIINHYGFEEKSIKVNDENIVFYTSKKSDVAKTKLVLYLQGSDPSPQFSYRIKDNKVQKLCWLNGEFNSLSEEYLYVVIEKIGFEGVINEDDIPKPKIYQEKNSLKNRVFRANAVIDHLSSDNEFTKIIVYGHSEGAPVGAKLATVNSKITHLGFWAGNALPDYYDFILENRIEYYKGAISDSTAQSRIDKNIAGFKEVISDSLNTDSKGYTNLRWWSYSEPPINNLLKIDIPVFVQVASKDKSAPIESSYLIPLEFARLKKSNLTYNVCVGCDHGFSRTTNNGKVERMWKQIFTDFIEWTEKNAPK